VKGYKSNSYIRLGNRLTKKTVKWFFLNTLPYAVKNLPNVTGFKVRGCYITTAKFDETTLEFLDGMNSGKLKPLDLNIYYSGDMLLELLKGTNNNLIRLSKIIQRYYFQ
jgi:hypothetical protein